MRIRPISAALKGFCLIVLLTPGQNNPEWRGTHRPQRTRCDGESELCDADHNHGRDADLRPLRGRPTYAPRSADRSRDRLPWFGPFESMVGVFIYY